MIIGGLYLLPLFLPLTSVQEARRAEIVQEAVKFGHWLLPYLNGEPYVTKPPLHTWVAGFISWLCGTGEAVLRLPSLLFAGALLFVTFLLARRVGGGLCAFLAVLFLAGAPRFYFFAHRVDIEMLMALWFGLYVYGAFLFLESGKKRFILMAFASLGAGFLTKGPFILLALPPILLYGWITGNRHTLYLLHPLGWMLALTPAILWYLYVYHGLGGGGFTEFLREDLLGRLATGKRDPFYHYAGALLAGFLPESILVLRLPSFVRLHLRDHPKLFTFLAWFVPLSLLSFTAAKFSKYLLSIYPFFALSLALSASEWFRSRESLLRSLTPILTLILLTGAIMVEWRGNALRFESIKRVRPYLGFHPLYLYRHPDYLLIFYHGGPIPVVKTPPFPRGILFVETQKGSSLFEGRGDLRLLAEISPFYRRHRVLRIYVSEGAVSSEESSASGK
ncbi:glycosyltransferase family 39 protein [Thermosulfurimonas sp. F29]|uniref:ArnT family glycosyltransferase n=1 Tax=Thermosulfurimonas sp. F29 TaxID=2867247 RepID=UPI001C835B86|nr:glycosyltransferase family 39 protein [Thermosulfurimonas sp. F29]MBX6422838.1 glycosyltransferase family 39 protein [Thermosulfurimonas sp. F29]